MASRSEHGVPGWALAVLAVVVTLGVGAGTGVPATRASQLAADEPQYLLSALSLAEDGDLDIADELAAERWRPFHAGPLPEQTRPLGDGRRVSPHDPLLPLLLAAPLVLGGWVGAKLALAANAGLLAVLLGWTAVARYGMRPGVALPVVAAAGLSMPLAVYGTQVYPELPAALATTVAIAAVAGRLSAPGLLSVGGAVVALPWLSVKYAPVAGALAGLVLTRLWRAGRRREAVGVLTALGVVALVFVAVHLALYGGVTPYAAGDHFAAGELTVVGAHPNLAGRSRRLIGLLVEQRFGLAAWQPAWLLAVPAFAALARRRPPGWLALCLPFTVGWLNATFVALTMHGWWAPGRQVVVALPAAVLAVAWWLDETPAARVPAAALGALGVTAYGWVVADGLAGRLDWVNRLHATTLPWWGPAGALLPSYLHVTARTWVLHGLWLVVGALVAAAAWRAAGSGPAASTVRGGGAQ